MATDYLRGHAAASVPGIRLICKYVVTIGSARTSQIQTALRPSDVVPKADGEGATMPASLEVARDIGLLTTDGAKDPVWSPGPGLTALESAPTVLRTGDSFRPLILREISRRALGVAVGPERPSDLSLALTWLLSRDPLVQLPWQHRAAEETLKSEGMSAVIDNSFQWNAFRRWLTELRAGTAVHASGKSVVLSVSTAAAIRDARIDAPRPVPAREFVSSLLSAVPVLGHEMLLSRLPTGARPNWEGTVSPAVAQGLLELETMKELRMLPGDDSVAAVRLAVGREIRTVRSIEWLSGES